VNSVARNLVSVLMRKRGLVLAISVVAAIVSAKTTGGHAHHLGFFDGP
jgi:hypothetical protein